jgi:hypothetical protein
MTPDGLLRFRLPEATLVFRTHVGIRSTVHRGALTTVFITPHQRQVSLIWQGVLPVRTLDMEYLDFTFIAEEA